MNKLIDWVSIDTRNKFSGQIKTKCPNCSHTRTNKRDRSLSVNLDAGVAKCHYCEAVSFRDGVEHTKTFTVSPYSWSAKSPDLDGIKKYIQNERKISLSVMDELKITTEFSFQPSIGKEVQNIVFNYYEGDKVVNRKFRDIDKNFTQTSGGKSIFYNINAAIGQDEVYIVEGEFDVAAMRQIGINNVISVPNGANDNNNYWENSMKYLKPVNKFIIAVDNDEKGIALREHIAKRLGHAKCEFIEWKHKDANGDLIAGELEDTVKHRQKFPVSGTVKVPDVSDGIMSLHQNGVPETLSPKHNCFGDMGTKFSVMRRHVITGTGIPSHGKSNFTEWYVLNLVLDYDLKASFFSPEHNPVALHQTKFIEKIMGKPFFDIQGNSDKLSKAEIQEYIDWSKDKIYHTQPERGDIPDWDWLLNKFQEQILAFGIDIFVIDAFNKVILKGQDQRLEINKVLTRLTDFAQQNNVIVFLIAHPTKMPKNTNGLYEMPDLYHVAGSADFRNQTHDGFCIYRNFGPDKHVVFANLKTKMSFQGQIGSTVIFDYDIPTGRYYVRGTECPKGSLLRA